ncbi:hypothetical protein [Spiroplasma turonicum]|nr:hypothetical protein [Spiroplasma turonicum]
MGKFTESIVNDLKRKKINIEIYKIKSKYLQKRYKTSMTIKFIKH